MKLDTLQKDMIAAMKAKDKSRKDAISSLVSAVKKAAIDAGCRDDVPEELTDQIILKELRSVQEQVDTCPAERDDLKSVYEARLIVIKEYAPRQLNEQEIKQIILENFAQAAASKNKGQIMKVVMKELKGKADGKAIDFVVSEICR